MDAYFYSYSLVNDTIARTVEQLWRWRGFLTGRHKENEIIWIQGYQLMLTPSYLSRKLKTPTHVGFFFHTPFPSSDVFRLLPWAFAFSLSPAGRDSFLRSLLTVNHIGFHLYEYLR